MMVGETPFERISNQAGGSLMLSVLNGSYTWPENLEVSGKYAKIVRACLTVDPAARPTIREVMAMIDGEAAVGHPAGSAACEARPVVAEARAVVAEARPPTVTNDDEAGQNSVPSKGVPNLIDL
jgi:hypothetical protein